MINKIPKNVLFTKSRTISGKISGGDSQVIFPS